jgi:hypothetical protein
VKRTLAFAVAALVLLAACSGKTTTTTTTTTDTTTVASAAPADASAAPAAAAATGDACALVTQVEASTAMDASAAAPIAKTDHDGYTSCRYYDPTKTKNVFVQYVDPKIAEQMGPMGGKPVAGVGDSATWLAGSIFVTKGGKAAQIGLFLSPNSMKTMDPAESALAKTAADRM